MSYAAVITGTVPREIVPKELLPKTLESLRAFVGLPANAAKPADKSIADLFERVEQIAGDMFVSILEKRTAAEFRTTAESFFNDYVHLMRAKSDLLRVVFRNDIRRMEPMVHQGLSELEADFKAEGMQRFGSGVNDQALFTIWLLRRTAEYIWRLREPATTSICLDAAGKEKLEALSSEFALYSAWSQLHLNCLTTAVKRNIPLYPDAVSAVMDGLRAMVNANALGRQILDLWIPSVEEPALQLNAWDDEDEELTQSSMRDIESDDPYGDSTG